MEPEESQRIEPEESQRIEPEESQRVEPEESQRVEPEESKRMEPEEFQSINLEENTTERTSLGEESLEITGSERLEASQTIEESHLVEKEDVSSLLEGEGLLSTDKKVEPSEWDKLDFGEREEETGGIQCLMKNYLRV